MGILRKFVSKFKYDKARIGTVDQSSGVPIIQARGRPNNYVYIRILTGVDAGTLSAARNMGAAPLYDTQVRIQRDPENGEWVIKEIDPAFHLANPLAAVYSAVFHRHSIGSGLDDPVELRRLIPGRVWSSGGLTINVDGFPYNWNGVTAIFPDVINYDISSFVPGSGLQVWLRVGVDPTTNTLVVAPGTPISLTLPLILSALLSITFTGYGTLAGVQLRYGQTILSESSFLDVRTILGFPDAGGSISDATPLVTGVALIEQSPTTGHPRALTLIERNKPNGLSPSDADGMQSSLGLPLVGGQTANIVPETSQWIRYAGNPLFGGTTTSAAQEPNVIAENGILKMWYTAGIASPQINYATSVDGTTWIQYGSNPVLGNGGSGYAGNPAHSFLVKFDGTYHLYFVDTATQNLLHTTSSDGLAWTTPTTIFVHNAFGWEDGWGNPCVWQEGYTWYNLQEYHPPAVTSWQISLFSSTDGLAWTLISHSLTSLQPGGAGGTTGGGFMPYGVQKRNGIYQLWYHGNTLTTPLPSNLYHATSADLINWIITNSGNPILVHTGAGIEVNQVADPSLIEFQNKSFLYFTGAEDGVSYHIEALIYVGRLSEIIDGATTVGVTSGIYAPLVTGDTPGPIPIATGDGQFIMVQIN